MLLKSLIGHEFCGQTGLESINVINWLLGGRANLDGLYTGVSQDLQGVLFAVSQIYLNVGLAEGGE